MKKPPKITGPYLVMAYRWGDTNGHCYPVASSARLVEAKRLAAQEAIDRGGKYGCTVYGQVKMAKRVKGWPRVQLEPVYYAPSMLNEREAEHNYRMDFIEAAGRDICHYILEHGRAPRGLVRRVREAARIGEKVNKEIIRKGGKPCRRQSRKSPTKPIAKP